MPCIMMYLLVYLRIIAVIMAWKCYTCWRKEFCFLRFLLPIKVGYLQKGPSHDIQNVRQFHRHS